MKIKDVITEQLASGLPGSWYDKIKQKRGELSQLAATKKQLASPADKQEPTQEPTQDPDEIGQPKIQPPAQQTAPAAPVQQTEPKAKLAPGVTLVDSEPVIFQVGKKLYYIMDDGLWHEQGNRNPVDATWNAFLNNQMDIALLGGPSAATSKETMTAKSQQTGQLTPAQVRQQKQAAAAAQARSQLGIKQ